MHLIRLFVFLFLIQIGATAEKTPLTTAQISDIVLTLKQLTENAFQIFGGITPASSNPTDNTLNVVLTDLQDGSTDPRFAVGGYFSPFDQMRVQGLSQNNRASNFGNVLHLDVSEFDPRQVRPEVEGSTTIATTAAALGNQKTFYQNYAAALMQLIQFQRLNPYQSAEDQSRLEQGIFVRDSLWVEEALAAFAAFRMTRTSQDPLEPSRGLAITVNTQASGASILDTRLGLQAPIDFTYLLHYPANVPYPSLMERDFALTSPFFNPSSMDEQTALQQRSARGLGFAFLLYIWEQLTYEGRQRAVPIDNLGDVFLEEVISSGKVRTSTGAVFMQTVGPADSAADFCPDDGPAPSRVCSLNRILKNQPVAASRCGGAIERSCFDTFFMDMLSALFVDRPAQGNDSALQVLAFNNLELAAMDEFNATHVPGLVLGARRGLDPSISEQITDSFVPGASQGEGEESTGPVSVGGISLQTYSPGFVSLTNQNSKADVDYLFADPGDVAADGVADCKPLSFVSRLLAAQTIVDKTECSAQKPFTVYTVPKATAPGTVSTATVIFGGRRASQVQFQASRVSTGGTQPVAQGRSRIQMALSSGVIRYADKIPYTQVDDFDPQAIQQSRHAFNSLDFTQSTTFSNVFRSVTAILVDKRELIASGSQPVVLQLWVDQNFMPSDSGNSGGGASQPETLSITGVEQQLEIREQSFSQTPELLRSVRVSGRSTLTVKLSNFSENAVRLSFLPCSGSNECGGLPADFFEFRCDSNPLSSLPDCSGFASLNQERIIDPFDTVTLPLRNKGLDDAVLMSFVRPSVSTVEQAQPSLQTGGGGSGCFIATVAYSGTEHPVVRSYRWFRDHILLQLPHGMESMQAYYRHSPAVARVLQSHDVLRVLVALALLLLPWLSLGFLFWTGLLFYRLRNSSSSC